MCRVSQIVFLTALLLQCSMRSGLVQCQISPAVSPAGQDNTNQRIAKPALFSNMGDLISVTLPKTLPFASTPRQAGGNRSDCIGQTSQGHDLWEDECASQFNSTYATRSIRYQQGAPVTVCNCQNGKEDLQKFADEFSQVEPCSCSFLSR